MAKPAELRRESLIVPAATTTATATATFFIFCSLLFFTTPSSAATEIVNQVCNQTKYYRYCVDALYTDPRTPNADTYFLAYIAVSAAYINATNTHDYLGRLRNHSHSGHPPLGATILKGVETCLASYDKAVSALESAYDDLNSESYGQLRHLSKVAGQAGVTCQRAFAGAVTAPVTVRNRDMKRLSGICIVVSNMLNGT